MCVNKAKTYNIKVEQYPKLMLLSSGAAVTLQPVLVFFRGLGFLAGHVATVI